MARARGDARMQSLDRRCKLDGFESSIFRKLVGLKRHLVDSIQLKLSALSCRGPHASNLYAGGSVSFANE